MIQSLYNLKKELTVFLVTLIVSSVILIFSLNIHNTSLQAKANSEMNLKQITHQYHTAIEQKKILDKYSEKFDNLQASGIVGNENRLHWVDVIDKTISNYKIPYLKYTINKQSKLSSKTLSATFPDIDIFQSSMVLQMQLLHEGDLFRVLNEIKKNVDGLFDIQSCSISKNTSATEFIVDSSTNLNFSSICRLNWYTIKKKSVVLPVRRS